MTMKVTLFYNQNNRGWTETWFASGEDPPLTLNAALKNIFAKAIYFRSALTTLEWVRFSVVGKPQRVNSFRLSNVVSAQTSSTVGPDVVSTDALWKIITQNYARRTISLRGLVDNSVLRNPVTGAFEPTPGLVAQVDAYLNAVYATGWQMQVTQTPQNTPGLPSARVTTISRDLVDNTKSYVTLSAALVGLIVGDKLRVYGKIDPKKLPLFPKHPTVLAIDPGPPFKVQIAYELPSDASVTPDTMQATKLIYNYPTIFDWAFQALSKRDTGRPFGSSRGRRSAAGARR